jgi:hypothetical protein
MELPTHFTLSYESKVRDYEIATQHAVRVDKSAFLQKSSAIGIVLDDDHAKQQTEIILKQMWGGRHKYAFSTTYKYLKLSPGGVITVAGKAMRIADMADRGGVIDFVCDSEEAGIYTSTATADDLTIAVTDLTASAYIPSFILLDIPALDADAPSAGLTAVMYGNASYQGGTIQKSVDGGVTWIDVVYFNTTSAKVGTCTNTIGSAAPILLDTASTVTVDLSASVGTLTSALQTAIIGSAANGWEILQFTTATLVSGNTYTLTNFYRGLYGTEGEIGGHGAGETFVLVTIESGVDFIGAYPSEIGSSYLFRAKNPSDAVGTAVSATIGGRLSELSLTVRKAIHKGKAGRPTMTPAYFPASYVLNEGTLNAGSGVIADLKTDNGTKMIFDEATGAAPLQVDFTFSGVTTLGTLKLSMNGYYDGNPAHDVKVLAWDYTLGTPAFVNVTGAAQDLPDAAADADYLWTLDISKNVSGGAVKIRIDHLDSGSAGHYLYIDKLALVP